MKKTISITMAFALVATLSTAAFAAAADDETSKDISVKRQSMEGYQDFKNYQCRRCVGRKWVHIQRERNKDLER